MRLPIALLALLAIAASLGNGGLFASAAKDHVKQLTSKNFDKVVSSSPWVLVRGPAGQALGYRFELSRSLLRPSPSPHLLPSPS
jgi:hypothetical protein